MGYFCDLDGEGEDITLDREELAMAEFFPRNNLPAHDDGISLTREMMRMIEEGREAKKRGEGRMNERLRYESVLRKENIGRGNGL